MISKKELHIFLSIINGDANEYKIKNELNNFTQQEFDKLIIFARRKKLFPLIYDKINTLINTDKLLCWKNHYLQNLNRNIFNKNKLLYLLSEFNKEGIKTIPLKGSVFALYLYGNLSDRQTSDDIDLLVKKADLNSTRQLLAKLGYSINETDWHLYNKFSREALFYKNLGGNNILSIDLHWDITKFPLDKYYLSDFWKNSEIMDFCGFQILMPSKEDLFLYLAINTILGQFINVKYLYEINLLVLKDGSNLNWQTITEKSRLLGINKGVFYCCTLATKYFNSEFPKSFILSIKPSPAHVFIINMWSRGIIPLTYDLNKVFRYFGIYFIANYLLTGNLIDFIKITISRIFVSFEKASWLANKGKGNASIATYIKRLFKPFLK